MSLLIPLLFSSLKTMIACYNIPGVISVSARVERVYQEIEKLDPGELRELLNKMADRIELLGWLKLAEPIFSDWENEEDAVYDQL